LTDATATTAPLVRAIASVALTVDGWAWPFAEARRDDILAHFAALRARNPALFNGRVLMLRQPAHGGGHFTARCFETDYASLLAWRDWGWPDRDVYNVFGMGALRGSDGVYVLGEMGRHTANAGRIYFAAGTPDLSDLRGNDVDIAGSIVREMTEETGLAETIDFHPRPQWHSVQDGQLIGLMQRVDGVAPGAELQQRIQRNLAAQAEPELAAIHLVRGAGDFTAAMPDYIRSYIAAMTAD
jgi:hypothetical protein